MKTRIPRSALEHHIAFVGKTGSEPALETGERVRVIDPTGAWWGCGSTDRSVMGVLVGMEDLHG